MKPFLHYLLVTPQTWIAIAHWQSWVSALVICVRHGANYCVWLSQLHAHLMRNVETPRSLSKGGVCTDRRENVAFQLSLPISHEPYLGRGGGRWKDPAPGRTLPAPSDRGLLAPTSAISPTVTAISRVFKWCWYSKWCRCQYADWEINPSCSSQGSPFPLDSYLFFFFHPSKQLKLYLAPYKKPVWSLFLSQALSGKATIFL